jgi:hypothetical protein
MLANDAANLDEDCTHKGTMARGMRHNQSKRTHLSCCSNLLRCWSNTEYCA